MSTFLVPLVFHATLSLLWPIAAQAIHALATVGGSIAQATIQTLPNAPLPRFATIPVVVYLGLLEVCIPSTH